MEIVNVIENGAFLTAIIGWFAAQLLKVVIVLICHKKLDLKRFVGSGGMPSSHSSFVVSLATYVGLEAGFDSTLFAVCFVLAFVTMYDAAGVRRSAGNMATVLNQIIENWEIDTAELKGQRLKELLGHTPVEVIVGAVVGIVVAVVSYFYIFH